MEDELADGCYKCRGCYTAEEMDILKSRKGEKCLCGYFNVMVIRLFRLCDGNIHVLMNILRNFRKHYSEKCMKRCQESTVEQKSKLKNWLSFNYLISVNLSVLPLNLQRS